jgi:hypothetical protein
MVGERQNNKLPQIHYWVPPFPHLETKYPTASNIQKVLKMTRKQSSFFFEQIGITVLTDKIEF